MLAPLPAAITRSGSAPASAPKMASAIRCPVCARAADAAGNAALTIVPSGARISIGASIPWFCGHSGSTSTFTA